jgi:LuxR family quorum-sensing system transcriptional regulator CciR
MFDAQELFEQVMRHDRVPARWAALTQGLEAIGLDQINYAFLDMQSYSRTEARGDPAMSTMRPDWIAHYSERRYDLVDDLVAHVRAGRVTPRFAELHRSEEFLAREVMAEAVEAGLRNTLLVPLAGPLGSSLPGAGITLGSSLPTRDYQAIMVEHGMSLVTLSHLFHAGAVGEMARRRAGAGEFSARERECFQLLAAGYRAGQIADRLALAPVTVAMHLRNGRKKMAAATLAEAVARAISYGQIELQ